MRRWEGLIARPNVFPAHRARAYTSLVGPGPYDGIPLGSTALTMFCIERLNIVWGDEAKPSVFSMTGGFAV